MTYLLMLLGFTLLVTGASLLLFVVVFLGLRLVLARWECVRRRLVEERQ